MDEAIKQIGERLKGLREVLNIPAEEMAELCEISLDHYLKIESEKPILLCIDFQNFKAIRHRPRRIALRREPRMKDTT